MLVYLKYVARESVFKGADIVNVAFYLPGSSGALEIHLLRYPGDETFPGLYIIEGSDIACVRSQQVVFDHLSSEELDIVRAAHKEQQNASIP